MRLYLWLSNTVRGLAFALLCRFVVCSSSLPSSLFEPVATVDAVHPAIAFGLVLLHSEYKKNESKATRSNLGQRTRETRQTGSAFRPGSSGEATIFSRFRKASGSSGPSPTPQEKCRGGVKSQFQLKHRSSHVSQYWCQNVQWLAKVARPQSSTLRWKRNNLWPSTICF